MDNVRILMKEDIMTIQYRTQSPIRIKSPGIQTTDLETVITQIPWLDSFTLGAGIDAVTGGVVGSAIEHFDPKERTAKRSNVRYHFVQTESDLSRLIEISAMGKYNIAGINLHASADYLSKIKLSEFNLTLIANYITEFDGYDETDNYQLSETAKKLLNEPAEFRKAYGDYFISGGKRGSRFTAIYTCQASSMESMSEFKSSFGAESPSIFSVEGSTRFMNAASKNKINIDVEIQAIGHTGALPSGYQSPDKIIEALEWFKENEQGVPFQSKLKHYSTIDTNIPRSIDFDPDIFVDLREFYTDVYKIRSLYTSCPMYYQKQLRKEYQDLVIGAEAKQNLLVTDEEVRQDYQNRSEALFRKLSNIIARMDFHTKVLNEAPKEPKKNAHNGGRDIWRFGFHEDTMSDTDAVNIHSNKINYQKGYKSGWREASLKTNLGEDVMVVGWDVISNRKENGHWAKDKERILGTNQAAIHVKSKYYQGCNWSLVAYYVDAKDYKF